MDYIPRLQSLEKWIESKIAAFGPICKDTLVETYDPARIKYKKCGSFLVLLYIPNCVNNNEKRVNIIDSRFAKFRAERAWCVGIYDTHALKESNICTNSTYLLKTAIYKLGTWTFAHAFNTDVNMVCASGIHYFNHWLPAYFWNVPGLSFYHDGSIDKNELTTTDNILSDQFKLQPFKRDVFVKSNQDIKIAKKY